jgi:hypothetical protein
LTHGVLFSESDAPRCLLFSHFAANILPEDRLKFHCCSSSSSLKNIGPNVFPKFMTEFGQLQQLEHIKILASYRYTDEVNWQQYIIAEG